MPQVTFAALTLALALGAPPAIAADTGSEPSAPRGRNTDAPRAKDDVSRLRPHEQHLYRRDMTECDTMARVDRQLCQRKVRSKARSKIRSRTAR